MIRMREMLLKIQQDSSSLSYLFLTERVLPRHIWQLEIGVRHFSVKGSGLARLHYSAVLTKVLWWDLEGKVFHLRTRNLNLKLVFAQWPTETIAKLMRRVYSKTKRE